MKRFFPNSCYRHNIAGLRGDPCTAGAANGGAGGREDLARPVASSGTREESAGTVMGAQGAFQCIRRISRGGAESAPKHSPNFKGGPGVPHGRLREFAEFRRGRQGRPRKFAEFQRVAKGAL